LGLQGSYCLPHYQDGNTLLILAARIGRMKLLEELVSFHADINKPNQVVSLRL
jgi:hypothetical protein